MAFLKLLIKIMIIIKIIIILIIIIIIIIIKVQGPGNLRNKGVGSINRNCPCSHWGTYNFFFFWGGGGGGHL